MARPGISTKNTEKNTSRPEILDSQNLPRKYRKNTPKIPKMPVLGIFSVFLGYFLAVPEFRPGGYFFGIFGGNSGVGPSQGSVAGRGVLNSGIPWVLFAGLPVVKKVARFCTARKQTKAD